MTAPAVSILMPVRNEEAHLPAALASLQRQTLTDWELVAVDDGSSDRTTQILADFSAGDGRIRVLRRPAEGLVAALNAGLDVCRAPLVARMDGDDVCHPRRLEKQLTAFDATPELDLVACAVRHFPRNRIEGGLLAYEAWQNGLLDESQIRRDLYVESPFAHPSVMFRRDRVLAAGGYRALPWAEDYDLWLRLARRGARFTRLPETLLWWRDRPQRLTRTAANCTPEAFRRCKLHHLRKEFLAGIDQLTLWGAGKEGKAWRETLSRMGIRVGRWVEINPRKIGQRIHGAPVVPPENLVPGAEPILITVGTRGARDDVRTRAETIGLREGADFICVT